MDDPATPDRDERSDSMPVSPVVALAANVRRLRQAHGLSLGQLSERSGVAAATLFKVESQGTNPTLETLVALAETFSVPVVSLLHADQPVRVQVVRDGEGLDISDDVTTGRIIMRTVQSGTVVEVHDIEFRAGQSEMSVSHGPGAREHVLVRAGRLSVGPVDDEIELGPGDYATYPADRWHRWRATPAANARALVFHTFPQGSAMEIDAR